jgi:DNA modification methylase
MKNSITILNQDFRNVNFKSDLFNGYNRILTITDPPYNQNYHYSKYSDNLKLNEYIELLSSIKTPCIIIHYPEETINILPKAFKTECNQVVSWVYNSNTGKQSRLISWWGCKPDFKKELQPYKNLNDKRIQKRISEGKTGAKLYDWWEINQIKNVSKEKTEHPCQIPIALMERIIKITAIDGDLIFDPFAGSGTTMIAANNCGFDSVGCDIDEKYCEIVLNRI